MQWANFFEITVSLPPFFIKVVDPPPISHEGGCHSPIFHESDWPFTIFHERGWPSPIFKESCWPPILCTPPPRGVFGSLPNLLGCSSLQNFHHHEHWPAKLVFCSNHNKENNSRNLQYFEKGDGTEIHTEIVKCRIAVYVVDGDWKYIRGAY